MASEPENVDKDPQDEIKRRIDWLFASYIQHDISNDLKDIAEYFSFLGVCRSSL